MRPMLFLPAKRPPGKYAERAEACTGRPIPLS